MEIRLTVKAEDVARFVALHPNRERTIDGQGQEADLIYTDEQWVAEFVRRTVERDVNRGRKIVVSRAAIEADGESTVQAV